MVGLGRGSGRSEGALVRNAGGRPGLAQPNRSVSDPGSEIGFGQELGFWPDLPANTVRPRPVKSLRGHGFGAKLSNPEIQHDVCQSFGLHDGTFVLCILGN